MNWTVFLWMVTECIYRIGILALAGFLCWLFHSPWGCMVLLLIFYEDYWYAEDGGGDQQ